MTKRDIVRRISEELNLPQQKVRDVVQRTFDAITEILITDQKIELRNFGVFKVKGRKPRKARNPRTGDEVQVEERNVVTFKAGKEMEQKIRMLAVARDDKTVSKSKNKKPTKRKTPRKTDK